MLRAYTKHLSHYLTLIGIMFAGFAGLLLFSYDSYFQLSVAVATSAAYVAWGTVHHILHKDFCLEVFFEYLAVAILGLTIIVTLIIRV